MTTIIVELYDALKAAGAYEERARKAAESVAAYDSRFAGFELRLERLDSRVALLTWMVGVNTALVLIVLGKLFTI